MDFKIEKFQKFNDDRGQLVVFLRERDLEEKLKSFGQIYFVTFEKRGAIRGNHYHKKIREWIGVVTGKVQVVLVDVKTGEKKKMILDGNSKSYIRLEIGPNIAHGFKSLSDYVSLMNYTNREWSSDDVFRVEVLK